MAELRIVNSDSDGNAYIHIALDRNGNLQPIINARLRYDSPKISDVLGTKGRKIYIRDLAYGRYLFVLSDSERRPFSSVMIFSVERINDLTYIIHDMKQEDLQVVGYATDVFLKEKPLIANLDGISFLAEYRKIKSEEIENGKNVLLPIIDHQFKYFEEKEKNGDRNIGWNAGMLDDRYPYFCENWVGDGFNMLTYFVTSKGHEKSNNYEMYKMLARNGIVYVKDLKYIDDITKHFTDSIGNEYFSINIPVSIGDGDALIENGKIYPIRMLNGLNCCYSEDYLNKLKNGMENKELMDKLREEGYI